MTMMSSSSVKRVGASPCARLPRHVRQPPRATAARGARSQSVAQRDSGEARTNVVTTGLAGLWRAAATTGAVLTLLGGSVAGGLVMTPPAHAEALNPVFAEKVAAQAALDVKKLQTEREEVRRELDTEVRQLADLRQIREKRAREDLESLRIKGEKEAREGQQGGGLLCATPFGVDVVGITQTLGLVGAIGGGLAARNRKKETESLNEKLRSVNAVLRQQARAGVTVAPGLSYVPGMVGISYDEQPAPVDAASDAEVVRAALKEGKRMLRDEPPRPGAAMVQFKKALMLARKDETLKVQERRAMRGLAVGKRQQGDMKGAIADLKEVLDISQQMRDFTGDHDALGSIADMYTELGDLEQAGKYYDMYLVQLKADEEQEMA